MPGRPSLLQQHFEALFITDTQQRLLYVNEPLNAEQHPAPLVYYGISAEELVFSTRADVPAAVKARLRALAPSLGTPEACVDLLGRASQILQAHFHIGSTYCGPAFEFPQHDGTETEAMLVTAADVDVLAGGFDDIVAEIDAIQPCVASLVAGKAVAVCQTVRQTAGAVEAGVLTSDAHRRRGHARRAVLGWASHVRAEGRVPLYSTWWQNQASRGLAQDLGLRQYGVDVHVSGQAP